MEVTKGKINVRELKASAQTLYYAFREQGLSHDVALAAVVETLSMVIIRTLDEENKKEEA